MGVVHTVLGEIDSKELGPTLFHEHLLLQNDSAWRAPRSSDAEGQRIAFSPVQMSFLGRLRLDPYLSLDNVRLDSVELAIEELAPLVAAGGRTLVEVTPAASGRNPHGLREIASATGLNVIMGCGFYLERTHPPELKSMSIDEIADLIVRDIEEGVDGVRAGVIGEIGVGPRFTREEERSLRAAARAQRRTGVPLCVHLPGWLRYGHKVLDIVEAEGGVLEATVLCHMNPSHTDPLYQRSLADRGAWIEYDMLGMEFYYPGEGQSPSDDENARAIASLVSDGYGDRLLLSHDVFLKTQLRAYGGFGYAHVLAGFADRLTRCGVSRSRLLEILTSNPRKVFDVAWDRRMT
ncbi:phosphotriesterase-related protein [Coriobacteriia bacterium Es71-Z0120]|uniref:phosphotriesterase family protein n=1 Tax=Parvivirga hydrogeniphila TaxID=2939460 RepID=UPI0022609846|nr:phosphotriesterase-related protein [Parvivirga hydrogeniphila]MCL4078299.1 phosphotriesterase-related protein [Parvivirga hydrogeniphila]